MVVRRSVVNEIRGQAVGVAIAVSEAVDVADLEKVHTRADMTTPAFGRIQNLLGRVSETNPDIRFIYVMRRSKQGNGGVWDFEYVVDEAASDENFNGRIDPFEESLAPGTYYDASDYPAMGKAWLEPAADQNVAPDPPYGMLLSGYAPVKDVDGVTKAIVGVDIVSRTIQRKLGIIRFTVMLVGLSIGGLLLILVGMYSKQKVLIKKIERLTRELAQGNKKFVDAARSANPERK